MKLLVENIRSLAGRHSISIKPLTLLVGENSSGKSTFLATLSAVSDQRNFPGAASLNKDPYDLGGFDTIATYKGGKAGRAKQFGLGFSVNAQDSPVSAFAKFSAHRGETKLCSFQLKTSAGDLEVEWKDGRLQGVLSGFSDLPAISLDRAWLDPGSFAANAISVFILQAFPKEQRKLFAGPENLIDHVFRMEGLMMSSVPPVASISPIRSNPKRTYDLISEEYDPRGDHIPFVLAKLLERTTHTKAQEIMLDALKDFGIQSGLYKQLVAKKLGHHSGSPFQINVKVAGPFFNLRDVGYGVSQSLPIIVQSVLKSTAPRLLLQQPEVHLHPRAQAAMGSFFTGLVAQNWKQFVIETHSDYLIDRIRQDVAKGVIRADDVLILFFNKPHIDTKIFEITLDKRGNIQNAPPSYREFFLKEELSLFNRVSECA